MSAYSTDAVYNAYGGLYDLWSEDCTPAERTAIEEGQTFLHKLEKLAEESRELEKLYEAIDAEQMAWRAQRKEEIKEEVEKLLKERRQWQNELMERSIAERMAGMELSKAASIFRSSNDIDTLFNHTSLINNAVAVAAYQSTPLAEMLLADI